MNQPSLIIREATIHDLERINEIYNHYVLNSTCTYQEVEETIEAREDWFLNHDRNHPVIVTEVGGKVVGWGSLSKFHARSAYRFTVENSIYVHHQHQKQGLGTAILDDLVKRAKELGHHAIIAGIDSEQSGSIALHSKFGFQKVAHLKQVGYKYDRWLDVVYMELLF